MCKNLRGSLLEQNKRLCGHVAEQRQGVYVQKTRGSFVGGERSDAAIAELNFEKRKISLSIKLLEEIMNAKAIKEHSSPLSGKNLPFSSLSEQLDDKKKKDSE